jgi:hypothetical protein
MLWRSSRRLKGRLDDDLLRAVYNMSRFSPSFYSALIEKSFEAVNAAEVFEVNEVNR